MTPGEVSEQQSPWPRATVVLIHACGCPRTAGSRGRPVRRRRPRRARPAWPGIPEPGDPLDRHRAPSDVGVTELAGHYAAFVRGLPDPPVIIGHSFGGLITQLPLDRGLGAAGVALHPAQPRGVLRLPLSTPRSSFPVLRNPANHKRSVALDDRQFHYAFANTVPAEQVAEERARLTVPGPGRPLFQAGLANFTPRGRAASSIDFGNGRRAPRLLVAGTADHVVPAAVRETYTRLAASEAVTDYRAYPGRDHGTAFPQGWEEVADDSPAWAPAHRAPAGV